MLWAPDGTVVSIRYRKGTLLRGAFKAQRIGDIKGVMEKLRPPSAKGGIPRPPPIGAYPFSPNR